MTLIFFFFESQIRHLFLFFQTSISSNFMFFVWWWWCDSVYIWEIGSFFLCVCVFFFKVMYAFFYSVSSLYLHVSFVCLLLVLACNQGSGAGRSVGLGDHLPASGGREPVLGSSSPAGEFWLPRSAPRSSGPLAGWLAAPLQRRWRWEQGRVSETIVVSALFCDRYICF